MTQMSESGNVSCYLVNTGLVGATSVNGTLVLSFVRPPTKNILNYTYTKTNIDISFLDTWDQEKIQQGEKATKISSDAIIQASLGLELETADIDWLEAIDPLEGDGDIIDNYVIDIFNLIKSSDIFSDIKKDKLDKAVAEFLSTRLFNVTASHEYDKEGGFVTNPESISAVLNRENVKDRLTLLEVVQKNTGLYIKRTLTKEVESISVETETDTGEILSALFDFKYVNSTIKLYEIKENAFEGDDPLGVDDETAIEHLLVDEEELLLLDEEKEISDPPTLEEILQVEYYDVEKLLSNVINKNSIYAVKIEHLYQFEQEGGSFRGGILTPTETEFRLSSDVVYFKWDIEQENVAPTMFWAKRYPPKMIPDNNGELLMIYASTPQKEFRWYNGKDSGAGNLVDDADPTTTEDNLFTYQKAWLQVSTFDPATFKREDFDIEVDMEKLDKEEQEEPRIVAREKGDNKEYYLILLRDMPKNIYSAKLTFEYINEGVVYRTRPVETVVLRDGLDPEIVANFEFNISPTHKGYKASIKIPEKIPEGQYLEELDLEKEINNANGLNNFVSEYKDATGTWQAIVLASSDKNLHVEYEEVQSLPEELQDITINHQLRIKYKFINAEEQVQESDWYYSLEWHYLPTEYPAPYNLFVAADEENERYIVGFDRRWLHHEVPDKPSSIQEGVVLPKYALHYKLPSEEEYTVYDIIESTRAIDNGESLSVEVDIPFTDLTIDLTKSYVFKLYNMYDDINKDIQEIQSLPATFIFTVSSSSEVTIKPYEFIFNERTEKYKLSFYRNFLWSGENGQTEGTLGDGYAFVNYKLRYKKDIDSAWSEYLFNDVTDTALNYTDPEGIVRVSHEITKGDTAPLQLEEAPYEMEMQIIYSITEGDPPVTIEYVSEPSRFKLVYSQTKTDIRPKELAFRKKSNQYEISFYRDFFWDGENGVEESLPSSYSFVNYKLRYKKESDTTWTEYVFNEIDSVIEYSSGVDVANITHLVDANPGTSPIPLDDAPYMLELAIIYSITEGTPPVTTELTSPPSRFYRTYNTESMSYIFDADLENIKHPKVGKWDIANIIGNGNGTLTVQVSHQQIGAALKDYTFFNLNIVDIGDIADGGAGSVYTSTSPTHTLSLDEYAGTGAQRKALEYLSFEIELAEVE